MGQCLGVCILYVRMPDTNFRVHPVMLIKEPLTLLFSLPHSEFLFSKCAVASSSQPPLPLPQRISTCSTTRFWSGRFIRIADTALYRGMGYPFARATFINARSVEMTDGCRYASQRRLSTETSGMNVAGRGPVARRSSEFTLSSVPVLSP
jgi:hypothetical protein